MRTDKRIAVTVVTLVAIGILATLLTRPEPEPEPEFGGRPLDYWVEQSFSDYPRRNVEAVTALRAMGQPAVQRLTEMVERDDSFVRKKIIQHGDRLPMLNENLPSKYWVRWVAVRALRDLGTNATSAIPALEKMALDSDKDLAQAARATLVVVKSERLDKLLADYLNYSDHINSTKAFGLLRELGRHAGDAVPALLVELQSTNRRIRLRAVMTLEVAGMESDASISAMTNLLADPDPLIRSQALDALANSGLRAKHATPMVLRLLDDQDDLCRSSALMFLHSGITSNEFAPYRAVVSPMTNDPSETVRIWAEKMLREKSGGSAGGP
jgi:HEAT repeat protein